MYSILSKCSVSEQFWSVVSWCEFGFLYECYVYVLFVCEVFQWLEFGGDAVDVDL